MIRDEFAPINTKASDPSVNRKEYAAVIRQLVPALCAGLILTSAHAAPTRFQIEASYRGGISIDFGRIGDTTLNFQPQPDGTTRVTGTGRVNHPREKEKILEFALDMGFRIEGNWVRISHNKNTANEHGKKLLEKIERIMPFVHVASNATPGSRHYYTRQGVLGVTTSGNQTVVEDGPKTLVTFYSTQAGSLDRFRVPTKDGALLNFKADAPLSFASARSDDQEN